MDVDDANESGDSKRDNEDLEVLRHALDESQRSGNGAGSSSGNCVACATDEDGAMRKHLASLPLQGQVLTILVPSMTMVMAFHPQS